MSKAREPMVVAEARAAIKRGTLQMGVPVGVMSLGWLPILPAQAYFGDTGVFAVFSLYMLACLASAGVMARTTQQMKWATDLVESWQHTQTEATLRDAMREEGMEVPDDDVPTTMLMGRIREHLEMDARALKAAEEAHQRLLKLRAEEKAARSAIEAIGEGEAHTKLSVAITKISVEAREIEGSLAALYATLITREARPTFSGLKDTMLELEAEVEVAKAATDADKRLRAGPHQKTS